MSDPTVPQVETSATPEVHPRGYTLADEEMERLAQKRARTDVLDPIALKDPVGQSVEKVILRVGLAVVIILVAGILLAQVTCKNIQRSGIPDFSSTSVTSESVQAALDSGLLWGGEITRFPSVVSSEFDAAAATVRVTVENGTARTVEQLVAAAHPQAMALAMNLLRDEAVDTVEYAVRLPFDAQPSASALADKGDGDMLTIVWSRGAGADGAMTCTMSGYEPVLASTESEVKNAAK